MNTTVQKRPILYIDRTIYLVVLAVKFSTGGV